MYFLVIKQPQCISVLFLFFFLFASLELNKSVQFTSKDTNHFRSYFLTLHNLEYHFLCSRVNVFDELCYVYFENGSEEHCDLMTLRKKNLSIQTLGRLKKMKPIVPSHLRICFKKNMLCLSVGSFELKKKK